MTTALRAIRAEALNQAVANEAAVTLPLVAKGVNFGSITANPDATVNTAAVVGVDPDLRVRPFFAQGLTISIREFPSARSTPRWAWKAFDNDLVLAAGGADVLTPSGMLLSGSIDKIEIAPVGSPTEDGDLDEAVDEIPESIVDFMEFYLLHYFKAGTQVTPTNSSAVTMGRATFTSIGCTTCHRPTFTDRVGPPRRRPGDELQRLQPGDADDVRQPVQPHVRGRDGVRGRRPPTCRICRR